MTDKIITRPATDEYRENWERIFGGFKPRADGGVVRVGETTDALFSGDAVSLKEGVITRHVSGVVHEVAGVMHEVASEAAYWATRGKA